VELTTVSAELDRPGQRRATMREVAALAGVSIKTVSRVVNDEPGVREGVRQRVEDAVERLHYRQHRGASDLRRTGRRTGAIGILVQDIANEFSSALLRALEDEARQLDLTLLAASLDEDPARERALVEEMVARRVDGLVLMPASPRQDYLGQELRAGLPLVFVDRPPRGVEADSVCVDNVAGSRLAVEHLAAKGHRRIAFLGDLDEIHTARERQEGWRTALLAAGLPVDPALSVTGLREARDAEVALTRLLSADAPPTAVLAGRNVLSVGALRAVRRLRAEDPRAALPDVVGFDDFELADLLDPPLTAVHQDVGAMARLATRMLADRMVGDRSPARHVVLQPLLHVRER
jgi:LacI family transcriptional regulator